MNKILNVAYWGSVVYLSYCAIDRLCMKSEKEGYSRGFEAGLSVGKVTGGLDAMLAKAKTDDVQEENYEEQDKESES